MDNADKRLANLKPFPKGVSGNPGGRAVGARNRLQGGFLNALADDFEAHGAEAIEAARTRDPVGYIKLVASILPKEFTLAHERPARELSNEELEAIVLAGMKQDAVDGEVAVAE